jgi:mannosyl-3-phosphoglycerate phosphatase
MKQRRLVVFSDLDGCLLDAQTYEHTAARPALAGLRAHDAVLVLVSSKTRAEMEKIAAALELPPSPFVVENGGALVLPGGRVVPLGTPRPALLEALAGIAAETGATITPFARLSPVEVARLTGLEPDAAERALDRAYDEPFLLEGGEGVVAAFVQAAARRGLRVTHGGRFHHLLGLADKGVAVLRLLETCRDEWGAVESVGLGDAANDAGMLLAVDRPIVVPRPDGSLDNELAAALPDAERAPAAGPVGWNAAVLAVLGGRSLPRVAPGVRPS